MTRESKLGKCLVQNVAALWRTLDLSVILNKSQQYVFTFTKLRTIKKACYLLNGLHKDYVVHRLGSMSVNLNNGTQQISRNASTVHRRASRHFVFRGKSRVHAMLNKLTPLYMGHVIADLSFLSQK